MNPHTSRGSYSNVVIVIIIVTLLAVCGTIERGEIKPASPLSLLLSPVNDGTIQTPAIQKTTFSPSPIPSSTIEPTPTLYVPGPLFDPALDLMAGPVDISLEIQIPSLKVIAPMVGVGLTSKNVMDAPTGPYDDPIWHTAFWYRGSSTPGAIGTATIAAHVTDLVGRSEIFFRLKKLKPGDLIIIHDWDTSTDIEFTIDEVVIYSVQESSTPEILEKIYGLGPISGLGPQPSADGLAHLTLITCSGNYLEGLFDHYAVVFATRSNKRSSFMNFFQEVRK